MTRFVTCRTCGRYVPDSQVLGRAWCCEECARAYSTPLTDSILFYCDSYPDASSNSSAVSNSSASSGSGASFGTDAVASLK